MAFGKQGASPRALCCQFSHSNIYFWPSLVSADFKFFSPGCVSHLVPLYKALSAQSWRVVATRSGCCMVQYL